MPVVVRGVEVLSVYPAKLINLAREAATDQLGERTAGYCQTNLNLVRSPLTTRRRAAKKAVSRETKID